MHKQQGSPRYEQENDREAAGGEASVQAGDPQLRTTTIVELDEKGMIMTVNAAWTCFAPEKSETASAPTGVDAHSLTTVAWAEWLCSEEAPADHDLPPRHQPRLEAVSKLARSVSEGGPRSRFGLVSRALKPLLSQHQEVMGQLRPFPETPPARLFTKALAPWTAFSARCPA
jgi:hypothetical protein